MVTDLIKSDFITSWGAMSAVWNKDGLYRLTLPQKETALSFNAASKDEPAGILSELIKELGEYFGGRLTTFSIPIILPDKPVFYSQVWSALKDIPYGEIISYKKLAALVGNENALRSVGGAMRNNPLPIIIPCHRVIASDGSLGGFSGTKKGEPLELKRRLLNMEGHRFDNNNRLIV